MRDKDRSLFFVLFNSKVVPRGSPRRTKLRFINRIFHKNSIILGKN